MGSSGQGMQAGGSGQGMQDDMSRQQFRGARSAIRGNQNYGQYAQANPNQDISRDQYRDVRGWMGGLDDQQKPFYQNYQQSQQPQYGNLISSILTQGNTQQPQSQYGHLIRSILTQGNAQQQQQPQPLAALRNMLSGNYGSNLYNESGPHGDPNSNAWSNQNSSWLQRGMQPPMGGSPQKGMGSRSPSFGSGSQYYSPEFNGY